MSFDVIYKIVPADLGAHLFAVEITIEQPDPNGTELSLPTWIPGSYLIRDFSKHLGVLSASCNDNTVRVRKIQKNKWRVASCTGTLVVRYEVYAHDLSVRGAHLDTTHGFFNGSSVFLRVDEQANKPLAVQICCPQDDTATQWQVATSMTRDDAPEWGFGTYVAQDYEELIDHPVEIGVFDIVPFEVSDTPHYFILCGQYHHQLRCDTNRLVKDVKRVCQQHIETFGEFPKMERYLFLTRIEAHGYGGLEHRSSAALVCSRQDLPVDNGKPNKNYRQFLGLVSHEYFHLWNVKRIKPAVFLPYELDDETYTEQLWIFEGITSYYDDLALVRSGVINEDSYFELIAKMYTRVEGGYGSRVQSLAESSFDAWIKFYKPDDNTPNAVVSYYAKGALVALCLDLTIRQQTSARFSLDDVMQAMWAEYGKTCAGVPEDGFEEMVAHVTGLHLRPYFQSMVRSTAQLPMIELLGHYGLELVCDTARHQAPVELGVEFERGSNIIKHVRRHSTAEQAGIAAGDELIALDQWRVHRGLLNNLLKAYKQHEQIDVHVFRRGVLMKLRVTLQARQTKNFKIQISADESSDQRARRYLWIHDRRK